MNVTSALASGPPESPWRPQRVRLIHLPGEPVPQNPQQHKPYLLRHLKAVRMVLECPEPVIGLDVGVVVHERSEHAHKPTPSHSHKSSTSSTSEGHRIGGDIDLVHGSPTDFAGLIRALGWLGSPASVNFGDLVEQSPLAPALDIHLLRTGPAVRGRDLLGHVLDEAFPRPLRPGPRPRVELTPSCGEVAILDQTTSWTAALRSITQDRPINP